MSLINEEASEDRTQTSLINTATFPKASMTVKGHHFVYAYLTSRATNLLKEQRVCLFALDIKQMRRVNSVGLDNTKSALPRIILTYYAPTKRNCRLKVFYQIIDLLPYSQINIRLLY